MAERIRHSRAEEAVVVADPVLAAELEVANGLRQYELVADMVGTFLDPERPFRLRPSHVQALHRVALAGLTGYAGNWRPSSVGIEGSKHAPPESFEVPTRIEELCDYINEQLQKKNPLHLAAYAMWRRMGHRRVWGWERVGHPPFRCRLLERREVNMRRVALLLALAGLTLPSNSEEMQNPRSDWSGGTVNIILASHGTLVAVTDSMLTYKDKTHSPTGEKLYRIDSVTIATMAGLYQNAGVQGVPSLVLAVPQMMARITRFALPAAGPKLAFWQKVNALVPLAEFTLTSNVQALVSGDPTYYSDRRDLVLELTIAGVDLDGSIKVADLTFAPQRTQSGVEYSLIERPASKIMPACEGRGVAEPNPNPLQGESIQPRVRRLEGGFFCDVAGLPDVAEKDLRRLEQDRSLVERKNLQKQSQGSVVEMRRLALDLEARTAAEEMRTGRGEVGGPAQVAVITAGNVEEFQATNVSDKLNPAWGIGLGGTHVAVPVDCGPAGGNGIRLGMGVQVQTDLTNCSQDLDGAVFHDSMFTHDQLAYSGKGPLIFDPNNVVVDSTLRLGSDADLRRADVARLMCNFKWNAVYQGDKEIRVCGLR